MLWYILAILTLLIVAVLALRLRVRLILSDDRQLVFLGLGRSGPELDFRTKRGVFRVAGIRLKSFSLKAEEAPEAEPEAPPEEPAKPKRRRKKRRFRRPSIGEIRELLPQCGRGLKLYSLGILRSSDVEELNGEVYGGFEYPDLTGQVFGYYQAIAGAIPIVGRHFKFYPVWMGPSFSGTVRITVALPLYKFLYWTVRLILALPVRKLIKMAIGTKKGAQNVKSGS